MSKFLLRTNPALTTNIKFVISSEDKIYMESFDSNDSLSNQNFKHVLVNENADVSSIVPAFYASGNITPQVAFGVLQNQSSATGTKDYSEQLDTMYLAGGGYVEDEWYSEEYEYAAPLYLRDNLPSNFVVMRIDGPGAYNLQSVAGVGTVGFSDQILANWKCCALFDLTTNTSVGRYLNNNYVTNTSFPEYPFELNLKPYQFSNWNGIEYTTGGFCSKSFYMDETVASDMGHFNLEQYITNGFQNNSVIMANILNLKFLFDDTPGAVLANRVTTPRQWSINRYAGFYIDNLDLISEPSPYQLEAIVSGMTIVNNVFKLSGNDVDPFVRGFDSTRKMFVKFEDTFIQVQLSGTSYILLDSQIHNTTDVDTYLNIIPEITFVTVGVKSQFQFANGNQFTLPQQGVNDLYLINVAGTYHVLMTDSEGNYYINSDWSILTDNNTLYQSVSGTVLPNQSFVDGNGNPITFQIYAVQFTDIVDLDFSRLDTNYSRFEYELPDGINNTLEPKLYVNDYRPNTDSFYVESGYQFNMDGTIVPSSLINFYVPSSSEYASDESLWTLNSSNNLTSIWDKNQSVCKWGYLNSLAHADYVYKLNNSYNVGGPYSRDAAFNLNMLNRQYSNLDWFYTVGLPRAATMNTVSSIPVSNASRYVLNDYKFQSLEVNYQLPFPVGSIPSTQNFWEYNYFDIDAYTDPQTPFDYFEYFFTQPVTNHGEKRNTKKYAIFNSIDEVNPPMCVFRGMKISIWDVVSTTPASNNVTYNLSTLFEGYKLSAVFSKRPTTNSALYGKSGINIYCNNIWGNVLIYIYVYVPYGSLTNFECTDRDSIYNSAVFAYDMNVVSGSSNYLSNSKNCALTPYNLILFNFINSINDMTYNNGMTYPITYYTVDNTVYQNITNIILNPPGFPNAMQLTLGNIVSYKVGDYVSLSGCSMVIEGVPTSITGQYQILSISGYNLIISVGGVSGMIVDADFLGAVSDVTPSLPFRINVVLPDTISVDTAGYTVTPVSANITPLNNESNLGSVVNSTGTSDLLPSVYNRQPLARNVIKTVNGTPVPKIIHRQSGGYAPITEDINLFAPLSFVSVVSGTFTPEVGNSISVGATNFQITSSSAGINIGDILLVTVSASGSPPQINLAAASVLIINKFYEVIDVDVATGVITLSRESGGENDLELSLSPPPTVYVYRLNLVQPNSKFDTSLYRFGMVRQNISKANPTGLPLKSSVLGIPSVYPMIDETGITTTDRFIFKSDWDDQFYYQSIQNRF